MADGPEDATSQDYFTQPATSYFEESRPAAQARYETASHPADEVGRVTQALERLSDRIESAENRQALAIAGVERSVREVIGRIDATEREQMQTSARFEGELQTAKDETRGLALSLKRIEDESGGPRAAEAMKLVDRIEAAERGQLRVAARFENDLQAAKSETATLGQRLQKVEDEATGPRAAEAMKLLDRIDAAEREQLQVAARFESDLQAAKSETLTLAQRLKKVENEAAGPRSAEALKAIENSVSRVAATLYDSDRRSREAIGELQSRLERIDAADQASGDAVRQLRVTCEALDERLNLSERGAEDGVGRAAAELAARVDEAREQLAVELAAAADARFDRVEQALTQMGEHVLAAEHRSASALERMGREVLDVAQALSRRVGAAERHSTHAVEHVRAEVSRVATAVEDRLARADSIQAQALEKLGGEIARITERLADRIGNAERRSAQAIDDVGEQVARFSERLNQRNDRVASELADRIRQSEERTAKLLEEARQKIDERLAETQRKLAEAVAPAPSARPRIRTTTCSARRPSPATRRRRRSRRSAPPRRRRTAGRPRRSAARRLRHSPPAARADVRRRGLRGRRALRSVGQVGRGIDADRAPDGGGGRRLRRGRTGAERRLRHGRRVRTSAKADADAAAARRAGRAGPARGRR